MYEVPPFQIANERDWWFEQLKASRYHLFWAAHERDASFSPDAKDLLLRMLEPNPNKRYDIADIREHRWYKGAVAK